jgi:hypothetical protein
MKFVIKVGAAVVGVVLFTVLPFLPGRHDILAMTLSGIARFFGFGALLLVPVGIVWLVQASLGRGNEAFRERIRLRYSLVVAGVIAFILVPAALFAAIQWSLVLGIVLVTLWMAIAVRIARRSRHRMTSGPGSDIVAPVCCILGPVALLLIQMTIAAPVTAFARDRAIGNSARLIGDIERFRVERGHYPVSLHSLWEDYSPGVMGISRYHYEPCGDAYNVFFEQPSLEIGAREIVMFNPRGEQVMTSHNTDLLWLQPADLERQRGFHSVRPTSNPNWKSFVFD